MRLRLFLCLLLSSFLSLLPMPQSCQAAADWTISEKPESGLFPGKVWNKIAKPESMGWDPDKLGKARLYSRRFGSGAVMIVHDGLVIDAWGSLDANFKCHSIRKSLLSSLYGIHAAEGAIDLDKTLADLGIDDDPPITDPEKQATVRHLLGARSGIYLPALGESPMMRFKKPRRHSHAPGEHWYYNNWDFNALGTIFCQETGADIFQDFNRRIAAVIGMQDFDPKNCTYRSRDELSGTVGPEHRHRYYSFRMSTRDLARFGLLFLRMGRWDGHPVVPEKWVKESTAPHSRVRRDSGYGYLWWTGVTQGFLPGPNVSKPCYQASGYRGQHLIVMPYRKLVVVHRVDTDHTPYSVSPRILGRLMWLILDASGAGEIGKPKFLEAFPGQLLDAETIDGLIGQEVLLSPMGRPQIQLKLTAAGDFSIWESGSGKRLEKGRWWMEGGYFLSRLQGKKEECHQIKLSGDQIHTFNMYGGLVNSYRVTEKRKQRSPGLR